ncbi:MAG: hypothetical protein RJR34_11460 [Candidatus Methanoculleus thermohydrogenotrophicum]|nr:hypothetical protein [Candidatus Methanoculleus thermohydrogenotrophicum]
MINDVTSSIITAIFIATNSGINEIGLSSTGTVGDEIYNESKEHRESKTEPYRIENCFRRASDLRFEIRTISKPGIRVTRRKPNICLYIGISREWKCQLLLHK